MTKAKGMISNQRIPDLLLDGIVHGGSVTVFVLTYHQGLILGVLSLHFRTVRVCLLVLVHERLFCFTMAIEIIAVSLISYVSFSIDSGCLFPYLGTCLKLKISQKNFDRC